MRTIQLAGSLVAGLTLSLGATALPTVTAAPAAIEITDDVPPKDDEKKDQVTVWVLEASGKG